ncbi:hypothetical protein [Nocardia sp. NPDC020380]|uniref:hypothetical protein n=1 Tax=Nocardia sp. NPDC020380 TaxID=3364309 RepID=UPI00378F2093
MTTYAAAQQASPVRAGIRLTAVAGVVYLLAWITGLSVWPTNPSVRASGPEILDALAGHTTVALVQYIATQGIAGAALALVVAAMPRRARISGYAAVLVSGVQCALGVHLAGWLAAAHDPGAAHTFFALINRLDGVKMLLLAITAALVSLPAVRNHARPIALHRLGLALAVAITISGIGYLLLNTTLAPAAYISGVLLLIWVTGTAFIERR